ncbi:phosphotransferase, partial [Mycobacterium sp. ITM-2017-0098]
HAVTVPDVPGYCIGYVQNEGQVTELSTGTASYELGADGLVTAGTLQLGGDDNELVVEVVPRLSGPLRMTAPDDRVTHFVRAAAEFRTADGRSGVGWIEWNINKTADRG